MTITYSESATVFSKHVVKLLIASFVEEKDFLIPLNALGVPLTYPNPWNPNPAWTPTQKAQNNPLTNGVISYRVTIFNNLPNYGVFYVSSSRPKYNIGRIFLLTGLVDATEPLILHDEFLDYNNRFLNSGFDWVFDPTASAYVVTGVRVCLNAQASGTIAFRRTIAI